MCRFIPALSVTSTVGIIPETPLVPAMALPGVRFFGSGTNTEKDRGSGDWRYTVAAGKAKRKSQAKAGRRADLS